MKAPSMSVEMQRLLVVVALLMSAVTLTGQGSRAPRIAAVPEAQWTGDVRAVLKQHLRKAARPTTSGRWRSIRSC